MSDDGEWSGGMVRDPVYRARVRRLVTELRAKVATTTRGKFNVSPIQWTFTDRETGAESVTLCASAYKLTAKGVVRLADSCELVRGTVAHKPWKG